MSSISTKTVIRYKTAQLLSLGDMKFLKETGQPFLSKVIGIEIAP